MLIVITLIACGAAVVLYGMFRRLTKKLSQEKQLQNDLEKTLSETQKKLGGSLKEAQDQDEFRRLASKIVAKLDYGVICIDGEGEVHLVNKYAEKFLDTASAVGKPYTEVLQKLKIEGKSDFSQFTQALMGRSQTLPETAEFVTRQGTVPISATLTPLLSDESETIIAFIFADNSRNVARITEEKAFFSAAAHELRTPLAVIRFAVSLLLGKLDTLGKEELRENLKKIEKSSEQLLNLVNDFLNVSRIDLGRLEVEKAPFDIVALTDEVIQELADLANERKLYVNHNVSEKYRAVIGDKTKAKEVLINLISNGIKYTLQGGLTISHQEDKGILLTKVADTGSGIPSEYQSLLFRRFMQVGRGRRESTAKSTGLGLYISKKFAQLMGGDVALEASKPGKGSTFTFSLPMSLSR